MTPPSVWKARVDSSLLAVGRATMQVTTVAGIQEHRHWLNPLKPLSVKVPVQLNLQRRSGRRRPSQYRLRYPWARCRVGPVMNWQLIWGWTLPSPSFIFDPAPAPSRWPRKKKHFQVFLYLTFPYFLMPVQPPHLFLYFLSKQCWIIWQLSACRVFPALRYT